MQIPERTLQNITYSRVLEIVSITSGIIIVIIYFLYLTNLFPSFIDISKLPEIWYKSSLTLVKKYNYPVRWKWISKLGYIDFICLFGLFFFSLSNIIAYISVLPIYIIKKNFIYAVFVVIQLLIFVYAAFSSGLGM